jgi:hypothetical protein
MIGEAESLDIKRVGKAFFGKTDSKWIQKLPYIIALLDGSYFEGTRDCPLLTVLIRLQNKFTCGPLNFFQYYRELDVFSVFIKNDQKSVITLAGKSWMTL